MVEYLVKGGEVIRCPEGHYNMFVTLGLCTKGNEFGKDVYKETTKAYKEAAKAGYSRGIILHDTAYVDPDFPKNVEGMKNHLIEKGYQIVKTSKLASDVFDNGVGAVITFKRPTTESISRKQLRPVINSFKRIASQHEPDNGLQSAMGPQAWNIQVERATQDFENYLSRISNRILGRLNNGGYAPPSALRNKKRPLDVDTDKKELSKVGSKATRDISKILGV